MNLDLVHLTLLPLRESSLLQLQKMFSQLYISAYSGLYTWNLAYSVYYYCKNIFLSCTFLLILTCTQGVSYFIMDNQSCIVCGKKRTEHGVSLFSLPCDSRQCFPQWLARLQLKKEEVKRQTKCEPSALPSLVSRSVSAQMKDECGV